MPRRSARRYSSARFTRSSYARRLRAEQLEDRRMLATLTVDTTLDGFGNSDGLLSLREAVGMAQDGDTITFAPALAGETITLFGRNLDVFRSVTIEGDFVGGDGVPDITIDGDNQSDIFRVSEGRPLSVVLSGLNLINGSRAVRSFGSGTQLTIANSTLTGNTAGAVYSRGDLTVVDSTLSGNTFAGSGGAIHSRGDLTVLGSILDNNTAGRDGGAIYSTQRLSVVDSRLSGNTAGEDGGAIFGPTEILASTLSGNTAAGSGGAIHDRSYLLSVTSSTLDGNSASSGGALYGRNRVSVENSTLVGNTVTGAMSAIRAGELTLTHSTVTGNVAGQGGAISAGNPSTFLNNVVAGNSDQSGVNDLDNGGFTRFEGTNLFSALPEDLARFPQNLPDGVLVAGVEEVFAQTVTLDLPNAVPSGLLADNGGSRLSVALLEDAANPAIDVGFAPLDLLFDVRGFDRGVDSPLAPCVLSDAGAFELQTGFPLSPPLVVTTSSDTGDDATVVGDLAAEAADGLGLSLREAVALANATPGLDQIVFDFGVDGPVTIFLAQGELRVTEPLDVTGDGKDLLTIDAQQNSRLFNVDRTVVEFSGLTLTGGSATGDGGAVRSYRSSLKIADSVISGSVASRAGGGVSARYGQLQIVSSTIRDNQSLLSADDQPTNEYGPTPSNSSGALGGGGVYSAASTAVIRDSLIAHNEAGGGQIAGGRGGGVLAREGGSLRVVNSTVSGNRAGAVGSGLSTGLLEFTLESSTVTRNQAPRLAVEAAFSSVSVAQIINSVVVENIAVATPGVAVGPADIEVGSGLGALPLSAIRSSLVSLSGQFGSPPNGPHLVDGGGSLTPAPGLHLDALADNGGPTLTHRLLPFSTAIDAGDASLLPLDLPDQDGDGDRRDPLPFDQRGPGFERVFDAGLDPGAIEARVDLENLSLVVTTLDDEFADFSPDDLSLREAIALAESHLFPGPSEITFAEGLTGVLTLEMGELAITESLTITGPGRDLVAIDANAQSRVLHVEQEEFDAQPIDLTINGLTIQNGRVVVDPDVLVDSVGEQFYSGGGVRFLSDGVLTLNDSAVIANQVVNTSEFTLFSARGGGIFAQRADFGPGGVDTTVRINRSLVSGNQAFTPPNSNSGPTVGGGVSIRYGQLSVDESIISDNSAAAGGGIYVVEGSSSITGSTVSGNNAKTYGGGVFGPIVLLESTVANNHAGRNGGGIAGSGEVTHSTISGNHAGTYGGGIAGEVDVTRSTISGNNAGFDGGGIAGSGRLLGSTITANHAGRYGGGAIGQNQLINSIVSGNTAELASPDVGPNVTAWYSLIGMTDQTSISGMGNLVGTPEAPLDALLGPLADNGGPTRTHALLPSSPALNAGDDRDPATEDQRGFPRHAGIIDIGAYEAQGIVTRVPGDYNGDGVVNTADYAVWRDALDPTTPVTPLTGADGDGDGFVTRRDRDVWLSHVGFAFTPPAPSPIVAELAAEAPPLRQPAFLEPEPAATPAEPSPLATIDSAFALLTPSSAPRESPLPSTNEPSVEASLHDESLLLQQFSLPGERAEESDNSLADKEAEEQPGYDEALAFALGAFE